MTGRLFVGGLPWSLTNEELKDAFAPFGDVKSASVVLDRETGRSRGFGFVEYGTTTEATEAKEAMDGALVGGRSIRVDLARERQGGGGPRRDNRGPRQEHGAGRGDGRGRDRPKEFRNDDARPGGNRRFDSKKRKRRGGGGFGGPGGGGDGRGGGGRRDWLDHDD